MVGDLVVPPSPFPNPKQTPLRPGVSRRGGEWAAMPDGPSVVFPFKTSTLYPSPSPPPARLPLHLLHYWVNR